MNIVCGCRQDTAGNHEANCPARPAAIHHEVIPAAWVSHADCEKENARLTAELKQARKTNESFRDELRQTYKRSADVRKGLESKVRTLVEAAQHVIDRFIPCNKHVGVSTGDFDSLRAALDAVKEKKA